MDGASVSVVVETYADVIVRVSVSIVAKMGQPGNQKSRNPKIWDFVPGAVSTRVIVCAGSVVVETTV